MKFPVYSAVKRGPIKAETNYDSASHFPMKQILSSFYPFIPSLGVDATCNPVPLIYQLILHLLFSPSILTHPSNINYIHIRTLKCKNKLVLAACPLQHLLVESLVEGGRCRRGRPVRADGRLCQV